MSKKTRRPGKPHRAVGAFIEVGERIQLPLGNSPPDRDTTLWFNIAHDESGWYLESEGVEDEIKFLEKLEDGGFLDRAEAPIEAPDLDDLFDSEISRLQEEWHVMSRNGAVTDRQEVATELLERLRKV